MLDTYSALVKQGWTINDIEETDFDLLISVVGSKEKDNKEVPLEEYLQTI